MGRRPAWLHPGSARSKVQQGTDSRAPWLGLEVDLALSPAQHHTPGASHPGRPGQTKEGHQGGPLGGSDHCPVPRADSHWFLQQALAQVDDLRLVSMLEMCVDTREHSLGSFGKSPSLSAPPLPRPEHSVRVSLLEPGLQGSAHRTTAHEPTMHTTGSR